MLLEALCCNTSMVELVLYIEAALAWMPAFLHNFIGREFDHNKEWHLQIQLTYRDRDGFSIFMASSPDRNDGKIADLDHDLLNTISEAMAGGKMKTTAFARISYELVHICWDYGEKIGHI